MRKPKYILNSEELKEFYKKYGYDVTVSNGFSSTAHGDTHSSKN